MATETYYVGKWSISHDDGKTFHDDGAPCALCGENLISRLYDAAGIKVVAVNRERGEITVDVVTYPHP